MSQKPARALYIPRGNDDWRPSRQRLPSDTRTITTGDICGRTQNPSARNGCWFSIDLDEVLVSVRYLWVVDDAVANSLAACLVPVGQLTCGAAEFAGLVPSQQSLTLQDRPKSRPQVGSHTQWALVLARPGDQLQSLTLATRGSSAPARIRKAFFRSMKVPPNSSSATA